MSLRDYINPASSGFQFPRVEAVQLSVSSGVLVASGLATVSQAALPAAADLPALAVETVGCLTVCGAGALAPFQAGQVVRVIA
jgi:hypothetical protein